ncbi:ATP-dependent DNA helicase II subunit 1 [Pleodorina starrii]|nr:ATP-dependent DNA helicase II subunit 1 [Pleodorina starrii]
MRLSWGVSEGLQIALKGYLLITDESKNAKKTVPLNPVTNQPLKIVTSLVSTSDGRLLEREEVSQTKLFKLKTGNTNRLPEVTVPASEVSAGAAAGGGGLVPPGLTLLGFKPLTCLKMYHQMRPAVFLRPDERSAPGSTLAFIAMWRAMLAEGRTALCRYRRANSPPQLVALVPADEGIDSYGIQTDPPGIHMIYLPYMDDVRYPETAVGVPPQQPSDDQLSAVRALVASLALDASEPFDLTQVPNPWLQRHYGVVEALALSEPVPEWEALRDDGTRPRREMFETEEAQQAVEAFRRAFPHQTSGGGGGGGGRGTKRKAEGEPGPAAAAKAHKAEAVADAYSAVDWEGLYSAGGLAKLTNDDLKVYLRRHQLKVGGKKDELVARVTEHLQQQQQQQ